MRASNTPRYFFLLDRPAQLLLRTAAVSRELLTARGVVVQVTDRAREVLRVAGLVVLERALVAQLGDRAQPARDHRPPEHPVVDHLVRGDQVRIRRRLLGDDPDVGASAGARGAARADPALEARRRPRASSVRDLRHECVRGLSATDDHDAKVGHLRLEDVRRLDDRVLAVAILDRAVADDREPVLLTSRIGRRPVAEQDSGIRAVEDDA